MIEFVVWVVAVTFLGLLVWLVWQYRQTRELLENAQKPSESSELLQRAVEALRAQVQQSLTASAQLIEQRLNNLNQQMLQSQQAVGQRLDNATRVVGEVRESLGSLTQATERVFDVGKDIASLQEILRAPKLRGTLGELFLGDLLAQLLPARHFTLQYQFKSGEVVDAVIHLVGGLVPVDSKFPLDNFRRMIEGASDEELRAAKRRFALDVKKHVDAISDKYIVPDEGTFDFALMYIPAENVYYETIIKDDGADDKSLSAYALERRVIPVSPNSFYAYLQAIVLGLKGLRIEKSAQEIIQHLARLRGDFVRFQEDFELVGRHLTNAQSKYNDADRRLARFGEKLLSSEEAVTPSALPLAEG